MQHELIRMENITKSYGKVKALDGVTLTVNENEILGLVGDNGAGKSTLIKILSGATRATSGDIYFKGEKVDIKSTRDAIELGVETIIKIRHLSHSCQLHEIYFLAVNPFGKSSSSTSWIRNLWIPKPES